MDDGAAKKRTSREQVICPMGDVELLLESEQQQIKLRVSSHVLTMASEVFKRMLTGKFKEAELLQR